jgi:hypothetical protein
MKFQGNKNKQYEKTQKQINELIGALNKYQSETDNIINEEINELMTKIANIKEEVTMIWRTSERKSDRKTKHNGRPSQQTTTSKRQNLRTRI